MSATTPSLAIDFAHVKARQQATWSTGNYSVIGTTLQIVGEELCESIDLNAGSSVLDVAAGNGNASLAAARRCCDVVSTDYVPSLLMDARGRANAESLMIDFQEADAEALQFSNGTFDYILSTFGVMFTAHPQAAASEMLRVCKPGGRIGLTNWTPEGFVGQVFKLIGRYAPQPAGVPSPLEWGTKLGITELFGSDASNIRVSVKHFNFRYRSSQEWIDVFRTYYGPINKVYEALDAEGQKSFASELLGIIDRNNRATNGTLIAPGEYLEVIIDRT